MESCLRLSESSKGVSEEEKGRRNAVSWTSEGVRSAFIDFFVNKHGHVHFRSSPIAINDPSLLFVNSGMVQFKPIFLGNVDKKSDLGKLKRAVNSQKCIRAGGKHNDLDEVGRDTYHHTFFEMLGSWSFGDYFQEEAIQLHWMLLTEVYKLSKDRLWVTYFGGDVEDALPPDLKTKHIWMKYIAKDRILPFGRKDNFWEMGMIGPCGPCTEVHFDLIGDKNAKDRVNAGTPDNIEICNLVFVKFNRKRDKSLVPLPYRHVDTGMGFERILSILQDKRSNYDTDLFVGLLKKIEALCNGMPRKYTGRIGDDDENKIDTAYRVIADHARTLTVAISDGIIPGPTKRGSVLRRILKRGIRYGYEKLGVKDCFIYKLVDVVIDKLGDAFPELKKSPDNIKSIIRNEEIRFQKTLRNGTKKFVSLASKIKKGHTLPTMEVVMLSNAFGFPFDLVKIMAEEKGIQVDQQKYRSVMKKIREDSMMVDRHNRVVKGLEIGPNEIYTLEYSLKVPETDDKPKYDETATKHLSSRLLAIYVGQNQGFVTKLFEKTKPAGLIFDRTNFYAEQGGQIGDCGYATGDSFKFCILDTQIYGNYVLHYGRLESGTIPKVDLSHIQLKVDHKRRHLVTSNHTSTHMLNLALRKVLGPSCEQKGSKVKEDEFSFDFSHLYPMTKMQVESVEKIVVDLIKSNEKVYAKEVDLTQAQSINGLRAVFGNYQNPVRVVSIGVPVENLMKDPTNRDWLNYSIEFCGGTHLSRTSQACDFCILKEKSVTAGIRRVIGIAGVDSVIIHKNGDTLMQEVSKLYRDKTMTISQKKKETNMLRVALNKTRLSFSAKFEIEEMLDSIECKIVDASKHHFKKKIGDVSLIIDNVIRDKKKYYVGVVNLKGSTKPNKLLTELAKKIESHGVAVLLICHWKENKKKPVFLLSRVPESLSGQVEANQWVKMAAKFVSGRGGGTATQAQGIGSDVTMIEQSIEKGIEYVRSRLSIRNLGRSDVSPRLL